MDWGYWSEKAGRWRKLHKRESCKLGGGSVFDKCLITSIICKYFTRAVNFKVLTSTQVIIYVCMHACMYVFIYIYMYLFVRIYLYVCMCFMFFTYVYMYVYICIMCLYLCMYVCTRTYKCIYLHMDVCIMYIYACMYTCMSILRVTLYCNNYLTKRKDSKMLETFLYTDKIVSFIHKIWQSTDWIQ